MFSGCIHVGIYNYVRVNVEHKIFVYILYVIRVIPQLSLHSLPVSVWVISVYSGFLAHWLLGDSKLPVASIVVRLHVSTL